MSMELPINSESSYESNVSTFEEPLVADVIEIEMDSSGLNGLDIQYFAVRFLRLYVAKYCSSRKVITKIIENVDPTRWLSTTNRTFLQDIKFNEIQFTSQNHCANETSLFVSEMEFKSPKEREKFFWSDVLMSADACLTSAFMLFVKHLPSFGIEKFIGKQVLDGVLQTFEFPIEELDFIKLDIIPNEHNLYKENLESRVVNQRSEQFYDHLTINDHIFHFVFRLKKVNLVFGLTSIQFGMRGPNDEIVGSFEDFDDYKNRFPGCVLRYHENPYLTTDEIMIISDDMEFKVRPKLVSAIFQELKNQKLWCGFCGKRPPVLQSCRNCTGQRFYCGRKCEKRDLPFHKYWCETE